MSPEKEPKASKSSKQKIILGIIVLIVLGVAWQMLGLKGGSESTITPSPTAPGAKPMTGASPSGGMAANTPGMQGQTAAQTQELATPKASSIPVNMELLKLQQQTQADYLASINKLQMLKIQREIDETKTAIANAELNRMTAEKNIADLITSKEGMGGGGEMGPIGAGGSPTGPTGGFNPLGMPQTTTTTTTTPATVGIPANRMPKEAPLTTYSLMSVAYQGNRWNAVIGEGKIYKTVTVGDTLDDGSVVTSINRQEVILKRDNKPRTLTLETSL